VANNAITLAGNLTKEPQLRTAGQRPVLNFRVAVDGGGNGSDIAGFFDCAAWGDLANTLAASLKKGQRVLLSGQLRQQSFESNGATRIVNEVLVDDAGPSLLWSRTEVAKRASAEQAP
jgi:single-strand DNA-binding protein